MRFRSMVTLCIFGAAAVVAFSFAALLAMLLIDRGWDRGLR